MEKDTENNILTGNFKADTEKQTPVGINIPEYHSNPIKRELVSLVYTELAKKKSDYKSFSKFRPKDLI